MSRHEHLPAQDAQHRDLAAATIEKYARLAGVQSDLAAYARRIAESILPDAVPYRIGSRAHYGLDGANGSAGRFGNAEIAKRVDTSPATCHRRIQRLFAEGHVTAVRG